MRMSDLAIKKLELEVGSLGTKDFWKRVQDWVKKDPMISGDLAEMRQDRQSCCRRRPDAYRFDGEILCVYEIEDTHKMPLAKIQDWALLWHFFDSGEFEMKLFTADRYGQSLSEIDLAFYSWQMIVEAARKEVTNDGRTEHFQKSGRELSLSS